MFQKPFPISDDVCTPCSYWFAKSRIEMSPLGFFFWDLSKVRNNLFLLLSPTPLKASQWRWKISHLLRNLMKVNCYSIDILRWQIVQCIFQAPAIWMFFFLRKYLICEVYCPIDQNVVIGQINHQSQSNFDSYNKLWM